jgi:putative transposase
LLERASTAMKWPGQFIEFYNARRPYSSLDTKTPDEFYFASLPAIQQAD